jgi:hypothetical protein
VRLGGLGNRYFGADNGIAEEPGPLLVKATAACNEVLAAVETALLSIHQDCPPEEEPIHWARNPLWWQANALSLLFGKVDRWGLKRRSGIPVRAFSKDTPLVSVLTGDAVGSDTVIRDAALARKNANDTVDYEHIRVTTEAPSEVPDGLGVGRPRAKDPALEAKLKAKTLLNRNEAQAQAEIVRKRAHAYRAQSEALRHHCDILLAIWDPETEGKAGGTSESVEAALREHIPVIAIRLTGREEAEIHLLETLRHLQALQNIGTDRPAVKWRVELHRVLTYLLSFPDPTPENGHDSHGPSTAYRPRAAFAAFCEDEPLTPLWPGRLWKWFDVFFKLEAGQRQLQMEEDSEERAFLEVAVAKTQDDLKKAREGLLKQGSPSRLPPEPCRKEGAPQGYESRYNRARSRAASSGMSGIYGDAHRGGIILSYLLAAIAVVLAVIGGIMHTHHAPGWTQALVAAVEVVAILVMYALSVCSRAEGWNAAYTDTRILAEALRMMKFLGPLGVHTPLPRLPYYVQKSEDAANPDRLWSIWYFRALVRMAPLRLGTVNLEDARTQLEQAANLEQRRYHRINAAKQKLLHRRIEKVVRDLFVLVGVCAVLHFLDVALELHVPWMFETGLIFGIGGPALIAAFHGFASQIEINRLQLSSSSMERLLAERSVALRALTLTPADEAEAVWGLATEGIATASLLMDETAGWSMLYRNADIHAG